MKLLTLLLTITLNANAAVSLGLANSASSPAESEWYVHASFTGGNPSLGTSAVTSYTEMTDASLTLTPVTGSAAVGTMCSGTNAATAPSTSATTCAAGSESAGINFALPSDHSSTNGVYKVCVTMTVSSGLDSGEAASPAFQLIETPTNAQTLTLQSQMIAQINQESAAADQDTGPAPPLCGVFNWTAKAASAVVGVRLMYEMSISGAPDYVLVIADADANNGQRNLTFTVERM